MNLKREVNFKYSYIKDLPKKFKNRLKKQIVVLLSMNLIKMQAKKTLKVVDFICIFALFYLFFFLGKESFSISAISHINILKAISWLNGEMDWLGANIPYSTVNLPGPFFYFLLFPPLVFHDPYTSLIFYVIAWLSFTFTIAFYFVKKITKNNLSPLLFLIMLLSSSFFREKLLTLHLNSLFSIFFHLVLMICLFEWKIKKK